MLLTKTPVQVLGVFWFMLDEEVIAEGISKSMLLLNLIRGFVKVLANKNFVRHSQPAPQALYLEHVVGGVKAGFFAH